MLGWAKRTTGGFNLASREAYDPQFNPVGPHITLVFPFGEENVVQEELFTYVAGVLAQSKHINLPS